MPPTHSARVVTLWRGIDRIAAISSTPQKCSTVGVPKARTPPTTDSTIASIRNAITTNMRPVSPAAASRPISAARLRAISSMFALTSTPVMRTSRA